MLKVNKIMPLIPCSQKNLNLANSSKKMKFKKTVLNFEFYAGRAF